MSVKAFFIVSGSVCGEDVKAAVMDGWLLAARLVEFFCNSALDALTLPYLDG